MGKKKPLEIDMIAGSQLRDTQGEMLSVEGADISDLLAGRGRFNDNHGKGFYNSIGRITTAKKIFKAEDCETDRQKHYWEKVKAPYIYVSGYLYDDEDHPNARAAAAILRNVHKADAPLKIKASVEGGVISRGVSDQSLLARTKIHSVALTFTPANNATLVEPTSLDKTYRFDEVADAELIKSVMHLAETNVPSFRHITRHASAGRILSNIEAIKDMAAKLGIPESDLPFPSKDELIKQAVEHKVTDNVKKINELVHELNKGHMRRLAPFSAEDKAKYHKDAKLAGNWLNADSESAYGKDLRAEIPRMEGPARKRALIKLHSNTESRINSNTGEKEFLLHRGLTHHDVKNSGGIYKDFSARTSFSHDPKVAASWGDKGVLSAWVPEKHIHSIPTAIGGHRYENPNNIDYQPQGKWGDNKFFSGGEGEIVVDPHELNIHDFVDKRTDKDLDKALMAGYGGAGAPTSSTGGAVIQSESLEDGRAMKYISCDDCGKEQVYSKYQVKCRHCNKSFPLEKLYGLITPK